MCVIAGLIYDRYRTVNPVWIIWFAMLIPDSDFIAEVVWDSIFPTKIAPVIHGSFHNILVLMLSSIIIGWYLWKKTKIPFHDTALCVAVGFTAHLLEDALVNGVVYHFYVPISSRGWYQGYILHPSEDLVAFNNYIGSSNVVIIGVLLLIIAILIRSNVNGFNWLEKYAVFPRGFFKGIKFIVIYGTTGVKTLIDTAVEFMRKERNNEDEKTIMLDKRNKNQSSGKEV